MEPVAILADKIFQDPLILKLDQRHMRQSWYSLQRVGMFGTGLSLGSQCPVTIWTAEIRDS